jgi:parallel beta-helix repeat protein
MRRFLSIVLALGLILGFSLVTAVPALAQPVVWVDDDFTPATPDWGVTRFATIQEGIDNVDPGGTVHVADGIYTENIVISTDGIQLLGAGAGVTTINAGGGQVVTTFGLSPTTLIDGFTITGGNASYGGGMSNYGSSSPTVSNCIFTGNHADNRGGGMDNRENSSPLVVNCVFSNNTSGDHGGGIGCRTNSSPTIVNCLIVGNTAVTGGGILSWSTPSPIITNCTIVDNTATGTGGGIHINGNSPTVTNNIIYDNTAASGGGIYVNAGATPYIDYNDVYYNTGGNYGGSVPPVANNISVDPAFVNEGTGDYHLDHSVPSPCIDAGDNTAIPAGITTDFDNDPRIYPAGGTVDMGADEYYVPPPPPPPSSAVGGEVYPIDKAALLLPWLGLGLVLILAAGGLILIRRRS